MFTNFSKGTLSVIALVIIKNLVPLIIAARAPFLPLAFLSYHYCIQFPVYQTCLIYCHILSKVFGENKGFFLYFFFSSLFELAVSRQPIFILLLERIQL